MNCYNCKKKILLKKKFSKPPTNEPVYKKKIILENCSNVNFVDTI